MRFGVYYVTMIMSSVARSCIQPSLLTLQFVYEYAKKRSWEQLVIFDGENPSECALEYMVPLLHCFGKHGMKLSVQTGVDSRLPEALDIRRHRVAAIVFLDSINLTSTHNILHLASQKSLFGYYVSWLLIATNTKMTSCNTIIQDLNIGIDSDVTVANTFLNEKEYNNLIRRYQTRTNKTPAFCSGLRGYNAETSFYDSAELDIRKANAVSLNYAIFEENKTRVFYLAHVYKIRLNDNSSLVVDFMGSWNPDSHEIKKAIISKMRNNFRGYPLLVGIYNGSTEIVDTKNSKKKYNDVNPILNIMKSLIEMLNATQEIVVHDKLGSSTSKVWTDLFHEIINSGVDVGFGYITPTEESHQDMAFSYPVVKYVRNIYYVEPYGEKTRDIFTSPFSMKLAISVGLTYLAIIALTEIINFVAKITHYSEDNVHYGLGEAILWGFSILCMQGSPWTPVTRSGKTVLLVGLLFALVIYNAYSGSITSILSVQTREIRNIEDLQRYKYKIGYSSYDEDFIRMSNKSDMRALYIDAFNNRETGLSTVEGLHRASKGRYAFFASASLARQILMTNIIPHKCNLQELYLKGTETIVALPMSKTCPYKKIINLSILRMKELGLIDRMMNEILPSLPQCKTQSNFNSAGVRDVYSAYGILALGLWISVVAVICERMWQKRIIMRKKLLKNIHVMSSRKNLQNQALANLEIVNKLSTIIIHGKMQPANENLGEFLP